MKNAKTVDIVERERESYNLEDDFTFKYLLVCLKVKGNVYLSCKNNAENLIIDKLYKKQKVDMLKVRSIESKYKNLNDTS